MSHPLIYDSDGLDYREAFSISDNDESSILSVMYLLS